jgi:hypothetical protein
MPPKESKEESSVEEEENKSTSEEEPTTSVLKKRGRRVSAKIPKAKKQRGRPPTNNSKNDHLLLIDYTVNTPLSFTKVDRTVYYKELHYVRSKTAPSNLPSKYTISVGSVVAVWQYGTAPFVVHALTNNNGTSSIYKMVVSQVSGDFDEELPECPNNSVQSPGDKEFDSLNVSEIWHLYVKTLDISVEAYPNQKKNFSHKPEERRYVVALTSEIFYFFINM